MLLKIWIIFALGWLLGAVNAIEVVKDGLHSSRSVARFVGGVMVLATLTTFSVGLGYGLFAVIVWVVNL